MPVSRHRRNRTGRRAVRVVEPARNSSRGFFNNKLYLVASVVIAILVIAGFIIPSLVGTGGGRLNLGTATAYVEGVGVSQEIMATKDHVDSGIVDYNSVPPTSGDHWTRPQTCGFYEVDIPDEVVVHNLEHSNIVVSYNLDSQDSVDSLREAFEDRGEQSGQFGVARRYPKLALGQVGLSAWGVNDVWTWGVDEDADKDRIKRFFNHYIGTLGPEGAIPCTGPQQSMPGS